MATTLYLNGKTGRMGSVVSALIQQENDFLLSEDLIKADVVLDFSAPAALNSLLNCCIPAQKPLVIGTTGYQENEMHLIREASRKIPLFYSPNFSWAMTLLNEIVRSVAEKIDAEDCVEIIEAHHRHKKDSPSGSALLLAQATGRSSIPIHSIRAGDIIGDHSVIFGFEGERLELKHQAHSRLTFARGALRAVQFLRSQPPGYYTMKDLLHAAG